MLLANVVDVPDWTTAVSGLIGIGVGIDYALLVLTRFRAALADGKSVHDAVLEAVTTAGRSVILAGTVVVISVLGLALTGPALHVRRRHLRLARGARRDARLRHAAARAPLLPRPAGRPPAAAVPRPRPDEAGGRRGVARVALEPRRPAPALARRDRGDAGPARAGDPRARHAPRLPRRRQRPAEHHDPAGLRPQHRGLRPRHQRPARDRRRPARTRPGRRRSTSSPQKLAQRARGRLRRAGAHERGGQRGAPHRDPQGLPAGRLGRGPRPPAARGPRAADVRRLRHRGRGRRRDRGARGPERLHPQPHAAVHRRRGRPLVPAPARRVPLAADRAQGRDHEPALRRRRLRRDDRRGPGRGGRRPDRHRPRGPDRARSCR